MSLVSEYRIIEAIKQLREITGCTIADAKLALAHMYDNGRPLGPPCVHCGRPLRTPRARLCAECGARVSDSNQ
jgi:hypothetical protein